MSITETGLITGGKVIDSSRILTSKEARKAKKLSFLDTISLFLGIFLLLGAALTLLLPSRPPVTAETGFVNSAHTISSFTVSFVLGIYNIYQALSGKFINKPARKKIAWVMLPIVFGVVYLSFVPFLDAKSLNFEDWTKERYSIVGVEKKLTDNASVVYPTKDGEKVAKVKKIDGAYYLYDAATNKELPVSGK